jgi:hypothetical protein
MEEQISVLLKTSVLYRKGLGEDELCELDFNTLSSQNPVGKRAWRGKLLSAVCN